MVAARVEQVALDTDNTLATGGRASRQRGASASGFLRSRAANEKQITFAELLLSQPVGQMSESHSSVLVVCVSSVWWLFCFKQLAEPEPTFSSAIFHQQLSIIVAEQFKRKVCRPGCLETTLRTSVSRMALLRLVDGVPIKRKRAPANNCHSSPTPIDRRSEWYQDRSLASALWHWIASHCNGARCASGQDRAQNEDFLYRSLARSSQQQEKFSSSVHSSGVMRSRWHEKVLQVLVSVKAIGRVRRPFATLAFSLSLFQLNFRLSQRSR